MDTEKAKKKNGFLFEKINILNEYQFHNFQNVALHQNVQKLNSTKYSLWYWEKGGGFVLPNYYGYRTVDCIHIIECFMRFNKVLEKAHHPHLLCIHSENFPLFINIQFCILWLINTTFIWNSVPKPNSILLHTYWIVYVVNNSIITHRT